MLYGIIYKLSVWGFPIGSDLSKEVNALHLPDNGWTHGSWNPLRDKFDLLGRMIGLSRRPSSEELQEAFAKVANAKVFAQSVESFVAVVKAERGEEYDVANELEHINKKLGTMEPVPFRSMLRGQVDPSSFDGVAILPAGTVSWMQLRWDQLRLHQQAGARFEYVIVLGSSRLCNAATDRKHPFIRENFAEGGEPTERQLLKLWINGTSGLNPQYLFPPIPDGENGKPLSLEQQLEYLVKTEPPYAELLTERRLYVPANQNALYVPLHVRRVLKRQDIWFSQSGARIERESPSWWSPMIQDLWTTPSGILRLWIELRHAGCITD
jgi:hypothetical protein